MKNQPGHIMAFAALADIAACHIVSLASETEVQEFTDAMSLVPLGLAEEGASVKAGKIVDVVTSGFAPVVLGGTVALNDPITADSIGAGVKADPAAGEQAFIVGYAMSAGEDGDYTIVRVMPGIITAAVA